MSIGAVLARLNDDSDAAELILAAGGLTMLRSVQREAKAENLELAPYVRAIIQRYATTAADEEWITVTGIMGRASDPGLTYVKRALESELAKSRVAVAGGAD